MSEGGSGQSVAAFIDALAAFRSVNVFNPYADHCPEHDHASSAAIRRDNLRLVIEAAMCRRTESIWIGRDLGYRGGRRTGLALTDDVHLDSHAALLGTLPLKRATTGCEIPERTAAMIWRMLGS